MSRKSDKFEGGIVVGQTKTGQEDIKSTMTTSADKAKQSQSPKSGYKGGK